MDALLHANNKMDMYVLDNLQYVFQISQLIQQSVEMELLKSVNLVMIQISKVVMDALLHVPNNLVINAKENLLNVKNKRNKTMVCRYLEKS